MISRILVPLDGSDLARDVLPCVEDIAKRLPAEVYFIQVVSLAPDLLAVGQSVGAVLRPDLLSEELTAEYDAAASSLSSLASEWRAKGIDAKWVVVWGAPGTSIVEFAHARDVDLIAMSTHGRSGLSRLIFGSVAEQVVREAGMPVLLVKPSPKTAERSDPPAH